MCLRAGMARPEPYWLCLGRRCSCGRARHNTTSWSDWSCLAGPCRAVDLAIYTFGAYQCENTPGYDLVLFCFLNIYKGISFTPCTLSITCLELDFFLRKEYNGKKNKYAHTWKHIIGKNRNTRAYVEKKIVGYVRPYGCRCRD